MACRRVAREIRDLPQSLEGTNVTANVMTPGDPMRWVAQIIGPAGSAYENGVFHVSVIFPSDYPFKPPLVAFKTRIFHPNVDPSGRICLDLLHDQWTPGLSAAKLLLSISSLLTDPNTDHGLFPEALDMLKRDPREFELMARSWTLRFAT